MAAEGEDVSKMAETLYDRCAVEPDHWYTTTDLLSMGVVPNNDRDLLLKCTLELLKQRLFLVSSAQDGAGFHVVTRADAARYLTLNPDEQLVLSSVQAAGKEGIWRRALNVRLNLHQSVVTRAIKSLESKNIIKDIKNVKFPARKIYMLASLTPPENVTGGPWFTDGQLDPDFVAQLCEVLEKYVRGRSFYKVPKPSSATKSSVEGGASKKRKISTVETESIPPKSANPTKSSSSDEEVSKLLPFPPGYPGYPTLVEIVTWINQINITSIPLRTSHVNDLMDLLYYDNRIERLTGSGGPSFRAVRHPPSTPDPDRPGAGHAFTETPCGRCPVFNLCEEGGPVSASSCEYFDKWLEI